MAVKLRQKNNDGKWWLMVHHKGQRSTRCLGRIDKRRAEHIRKEVETRLAMEDLGLLRSQAPTVEQYAADWLRIIEVRCKHATLTRYTSIVTMHILPYIGHLEVNRVATEHCKDMMLAWQKQMHYGGAKTVYSVTKAMFNECIQDKHIDKNPLPKFARIFGAASATPVKDRVRVIPHGELDLILQHAGETLPQAYGALFTFIARTGCRLGEALAMSWPCVNLQAGTADIRATYSTQHGLSSPKSGKSRTVALSPTAVHTLRDLKRHVEKAFWANGRDVPEAVFITQSTGNRIAPELARKQWNRCLRALGLPGYLLHDLRHTFASRLLAMGEPIKTVQTALGHHSSKMTLDVYGHLMPDRPYPNVAALDAAPMRTHSTNHQARA